jgi:CheY-like chemotaxis protein
MEAVGQLTGGLAHDFNNLLAIVLGNLDLLSERLDHPEFKEAFVRPAIAAAERGSQLTQRLLAFGRRQSLQPATTDVNGLVEGMAEMLRLTLGQGVRIRIAPSPALWPTRIDPGQLENALINLAANARDAMDGGGQLTIETHNVTLDDDYAHLYPEVEPGAYVRLTVTDTGQGMPPDIAARAFEPFFTTKEVGKGTGLGLSMVYGFIRQSGGHIRLYSEPRFGTVVALYLPRADNQEAPAAEPDPVSLPASGELILIVEDDPDMLVVTAGMVADLGYRTLTATSATEARALLDAHADIDLLFTDLMLSGDTDGIALAEGACARRPALKVAYTSGFAESALSGRTQGGDIMVLQKPFRRGELGQRLRQALHAAGGCAAQDHRTTDRGAEARRAAGQRP